MIENRIQRTGDRQTAKNHHNTIHRKASKNDLNKFINKDIKISQAIF